MEGLIIVNKPKDWTSFDVVAKLRRLTSIKKIGHSGTLDPMATGVLPVFIGRQATRYIEHFMSGDKGYIAEITLGIRTDTGDATGKPQTSDVRLLDVSQVSIHNIEKVLKKYLGEIEQVPPMYSAVKVNGQRLYKLARQGKTVERKPRKVKIHKIDILNFENTEEVKLTIEVSCSKGTYIRQLAMDIGDDLGCGGHLSKLMRTYAHPFHVTQSINMDTIITLAGLGRLSDIIIPVEGFLKGLTPAA
ncbi:MAG: tRNA pseudouridine(55) synthase TruB [Candidatus Saganbacteria bacterium]|nr:tRNA pseudouridine(55) synthase TruB [Candidatus Saganbacteria bacterium]